VINEVEGKILVKVSMANEGLIFLRLDFDMGFGN